MAHEIPLERPEAGGHRYLLRLYVAGQTPRSLAAIDNLTRICQEHLQERYQVEVIDLAVNPERAVATTSSLFRRWCATYQHRYVASSAISPTPKRFSQV